MKRIMDRRMHWIGIIVLLVTTACTTIDPASGENDSSTQYTEPQAKHPTEISSDQQETPVPSPISYDVEEPYSNEHPTLMGFALGQTLDEVIQRFGEPIEQYQVEEEEIVTLFEYPSFTFGFNTQQEVLFVEVHSALVNPGLNGLRLGASREQALQLLGEPNQSSEYVLSYQTDTAVLKLDLDPSMGTIHSMKLFGAESL